MAPQPNKGPDLRFIFTCHLDSCQCDGLVVSTLDEDQSPYHEFTNRHGYGNFTRVAEVIRETHEGAA